MSCVSSNLTYVHPSFTLFFVLFWSLDVALKTVKRLSVKLWTLLALDGRHLGYVADGEGPFFKLEMAAKDVVTTVNVATLYKSKLYMFFYVYKPPVCLLG